MGGFGGGGGGSYGGGGSGGYSYANPALATSVIHTRGYNATGNGVVTITPSCVPPGSITGGASNLCVGSTVHLYNTSPSSCGTWFSNNSAIATVDTSSGVVLGVSVDQKEISDGTASFNTNLLPAGIYTVICTGNFYIARKMLLKLD